MIRFWLRSAVAVAVMGCAQLVWADEAFDLGVRLDYELVSSMPWPVVCEQYRQALIHEPGADGIWANVSGETKRLDGLVPMRLEAQWDACHVGKALFFR